MTPEEIIDLLTLAAAVDGRDVGQTDVAAWHMVIGDLTFADAQEALAGYYRETRYRVMPADIRQRVKAIRRQRLEHAVIPAPPPELTDRPRDYRAELARRIHAIAAGKAPDAAVTAGTALRAIQGGRA